MSRTTNFIKNSEYKAITLVLNAGLNLINRYFFMKLLGAEYLGISGLFSSIFGVLTFADLGLTSAFSFCFYTSIARNDTRHSAFLIGTLHKLLNKIILFMLTFGLLLVPWVPSLIKGAQMVDQFHLRLYYVLYLIDLLNSYLYMAKTCYVAAHQKEYQLTPITTVFSVLKVFVSLACLYATANFTVFLVSGIFVTAVQRFFLNYYIGKKYPETKDKVSGTLTENERTSIRRNVMAAFVHKLASVSVLQTDNILISMGVGIVSTGLVSNYVAIKSAVTSVISTINTSMTAGMGNVMALESKDKQLDVFYLYLTLNTFLTCGSFLGLSILSSPFIKIVFGETACLETSVVFCMTVPILLMFSTYSLNLLPSASGRNNVGISMVWVEGIANLVISIVAMQRFGLLGVYIGTVASEGIVYICKPFIVMKALYQCSPVEYFRITCKGICVTLILYGLIQTVQAMWFPTSVSISSFAGLLCLTAGSFLVVYSLVWIREERFRRLIQMGIRVICKRR